MGKEMPIPMFSKTTTSLLQINITEGPEDVKLWIQLKVLSFLRIRIP